MEDNAILDNTPVGDIPTVKRTRKSKDVLTKEELLATLKKIITDFKAGKEGIKPIDALTAIAQYSKMEGFNAPDKKEIVVDKLRYKL